VIEAIHVGPEEGGPLHAVDSVNAVAGKGLEGDRHFSDRGARPGGALTLVEAEEVDRVGLGEGESRRQLTVRGVRLPDLVGKTFKVGEVEVYGVELCEPCTHLESLTRPGIIQDMVHRAGINCDILSDGVISVGDAITV
jgi:MOSC domain-containing protein YiiM